MSDKLWTYDTEYKCQELLIYVAFGEERKSCH